MSAWKRNRGWTERHGWGPDVVARWIGRQRREVRRPTVFGRIVFPMAVRSEVKRELVEAEELEQAAWDVYSSLPRGVPADLFSAARDAWVKADENRSALRQALGAAT